MTHAPRFVVHLASVIAIASGGAGILRRVRRTRVGGVVHILEYHGISESGEPEGLVSRDRLLKHLVFLKKRFRVVSLTEATHLLSRESGLKEDFVVVTFDDGYENNFKIAWPILEQQGVPATIFLTTGFLDGTPLWFDIARKTLTSQTHREDLRRALAKCGLSVTDPIFGSWANRVVEKMKYLPEDDRLRVLNLIQATAPTTAAPQDPLLWSQVQAMQRSGIEIGGHSVSHPIFSRLTVGRQEEEIYGCWHRIQEATGVAPTAFSVPNGSRRDYDETTLAILRASDFTCSTTTRRGANLVGCNPYTLRRIGVGADSNSTLLARLSGLFDDEIRKRLVPISKDRFVGY